MELDLNKLQQLLANPTVQQLLQSLLAKVTQGQGQGQGSGANPLGGLLEQLSGSGLQEQVQSWLGGGENKPVTGDEVKQAVGEDTISKIAEETGMSKEDAAKGLAQVLPTVVDTASPDGKVDEKALSQAAG